MSSASVGPKSVSSILTPNKGASWIYVNARTGDALGEPPDFAVFAEMAHLAAAASQDVDGEVAGECAEQVREIRQEAMREAEAIAARWTQHMDR